jgi:DNA-binding response OmpR family regulator
VHATAARSWYMPSLTGEETAEARRGGGTMRAQRILIFEPCCLDVGNARLWRGPEATHLTRKAFAVLHYLGTLEKLDSPNGR